MQDMYAIGKEAHEYNEQILGWNAIQKPLVVVHFDRQKEERHLKRTGNLIATLRMYMQQMKEVQISYLTMLKMESDLYM
ncbi:hypothetical protein AAHB59_13405 [Bacillus cereus]